MKKLIALTLCLMLLLSGCAYAGGPGEGLRLRDMLCSNGTEDVLDAQGLSAALEYGHNDDVMGLRLTVSKDDGEANEAVLALVDDTLLLTLDGSTGESYVYAITDPEVVSTAAETLAGLFPEADGEPMPDFENMTEEEMEQYMAQLEQELEEMGLTGEGAELTPEQERELEETTIKLERFQELIESCTTAGEPQQFDGESYDTTRIDIDSDTMRELLDLLQVSEMVSDNASLGQMLADAGITAELSAVIAINEDGTKSAYGMSPVFTSDEGDRVKINFTVQNTHDDGSADVYLDLALNGETQAAFSITYEVYDLEDADWLPAAVPADAAALDLEDEQSLDGFVEGLSDFLGQVSGTVMGVTMTNRLIGLLR